MSATGGWRDDPDGVRPVVLVIGGFLSSPPLFEPLARRLVARGAVDALVAPIWTPHWILGAAAGMHVVLRRAGRALLEADRRSGASTASRGAPVLVVGHSAGGVTARVLTSPEPFHGMRLGAGGRIGAIVTLGSPHHVRPVARLGGRISSKGAEFAERAVPGATFAPLIGYVTVATRGVVGRPDGTPRERSAANLYAGLLGKAAASGPIEGDGLVPVEAALLDDATRIVLDDAVHGPLSARRWYGSDDVVDRWWPAALDAWHGALRARVEGQPMPGPRPAIDDSGDAE
jgi:hypothetical protein